MPGDSSVLAASGDVAAATTRVHDGGEAAAGSNSGEEDKNSSVRVDEGERMNYGANRWPRQETLALLKVRSDMDAVFRDSSLKGPLWEEVSRKLAELGYHRSAKKCKEKFENVYKYHKRTKDGRTSKSEGKTYRFFDQLEAFENHPSHSPPPALPPPPPPKSQTPMATTATLPWSTSPPNISHVTVPSTTNPMDIMHQNNNIVSPTANPVIPAPLSYQPINPLQNILPSSLQNLTSHLFSSSTSSSTASDEELEGSRKRKRKWKVFFERLARDVIKKQEALQRKFLETIEKREHERIVREEAWRMQEMARINKEHEILIQERSTAAAKDAVVVTFLQKISGLQNPEDPQPTVLPPPPPVLALQPPPIQPRPTPASLAPPSTKLDAAKRDDGQNNVAIPSSSRWPKPEVEALIRLRTSLDIKYQENGPKGPLWLEISDGMRQLGYNRSAKRCKEKWENINKYFKKVKESNKKRPEDSKTCPYFHQLDALYKKKKKIENSINSSGYAIKPINTMEPLMVLPEQQWPLQQETHPETTVIEDNEKDNIEEDEEEDDDDDGDTEEEDEGGGFEVVANRSASMGNGE